MHRSLSLAAILAVLALSACTDETPQSPPEDESVGSEAADGGIHTSRQAGKGVSQWSRTESGTTSLLKDVWTTQAREPLAGFVTSSTPGEILSLQGNGGWSKETLALPWKLNGVWGRSDKDAYAVGDIDTERPPDAEYAFRAVVLQRRGGSWLEMPGLTPPAGREGVPWTLADAWGSGPDLFAVGGFYSPREGEQVGALVAHYNGTAWSTTWLLQTEFSGLADVSGTSPSDVYAVGYTAGPNNDFDPGYVLHYNGRSWTEVLRKGNSTSVGVRMNGVWAASRKAVFAVGFEYDGGPHTGFVLRYDGKSWFEIFRGENLTLQAVWGTSPKDVYAVGTDGTILHYNGVGWTRQASTTDRWLYGIWGRSRSDVFVVGEGGTILHGTP